MPTPEPSAPARLAEAQRQRAETEVIARRDALLALFALQAQRLGEATRRNAEALEFAEQREDVDDGPEGQPTANKWMLLANILRGDSRE